jgi:hypothetical protein
MECDFTFVCDKEWYQLRPLKDDELPNKDFYPDARYCISCQKNVFKVETEEQLKIALKRGDCICVGKFDKQKKKWLNRAVDSTRTIGLPRFPPKSINGDE